MDKSEIEIYCPSSQSDWRNWLETNHSKVSSVWLVYYKKKSSFRTFGWSEAVDEAICFGWIDSTAKSIDDEKYMQLFTKRKPNSMWSKINKEKVSQLIETKQMTTAGYHAIEIAKQNGSWTILDQVEALIIPEDLAFHFKQNPEAESFFLTLSKSDKKIILQWIVFAKRQDTRNKRINEIIEFIEQGKKPKILG